MPEPLIPFALYDECVKIGGSNNLSGAMSLISGERGKELITPGSRATLRRLMHFCADLAKHESTTRMGGPNLALVFAPNLLKNQSNDPMIFARNAESEKNFVALLIQATGKGLWQIS
jgi:hypothetical protein